jgi:hypothetical protein
MHAFRQLGPASRERPRDLTQTPSILSNQVQQPVAARADIQRSGPDFRTPPSSLKSFQLRRCELLVSGAHL